MATKKRLQEFKEMSVGLRTSGKRVRPMSASKLDLVTMHALSPKEQEKNLRSAVPGFAATPATTMHHTGPIKIHMDEEAIDRILANVAEN